MGPYSITLPDVPHQMCGLLRTQYLHKCDPYFSDPGCLFIPDWWVINRQLIRKLNYSRNFAGPDGRNICDHLVVGPLVIELSLCK